MLAVIINDHLFDADFCATGWIGNRHRGLWTVEELMKKFAYLQSIKEN